MREKIVSKRIGSATDMAWVEAEIGRIMGCEERKCSLVDSNDFVSLRLCALYGRGGKKAPLSVYRGDLQIKLDSDNTLTVYLLTSELVALEDLPSLGKRLDPEDPVCMGLIDDSQ